MKLHARGHPANLSHEILACISDANSCQKGGVLFFSEPPTCEVDLENCQALVTTFPLAQAIKYLPKHLPAISNLNSRLEVSNGDVVLLRPDGQVHILYRRQSAHNNLFITNRCNSNCLMCSQPPRDIDDLSYFFDLNMRLLDFIDPETKAIGITGGEPTLLGPRLFILLRKAHDVLPNTDLHLLTNGRAFAWSQFLEMVSSLRNNRITFAIPLYSDHHATHDYIVQAQNAFSQTVLGIYNLARLEQRIEIRIVLHKLVIPRLYSLVRFIYRNMPFVDHVALMGLENTGYTPYNNELLWIDPREYGRELVRATQYLADLGIHVSIYNLQHCLLEKELWPYSRRSISDWKQIYLEECNVCKVQRECGGLFATADLRLQSIVKRVT